MRIAVFGATGRTGRPLVEQALERGNEVFAFVRHGTELTLGMRDTAARANVAETILECLEADRYVHEMPKVADA